MATNRFDELWESADDGASTPVGYLEPHDDAEFDGLLDAWFVERQNCIEFEILLDESRKLIRRLIAETDASSPSRRSARRLIQAIDESLKSTKP